MDSRLPAGNTSANNGRKMVKLAGAMTAVATAISILQGPAAINEFPEQSIELVHNVEKVASIAANRAMDLDFELGEFLERAQ